MKDFGVTILRVTAGIMYMMRAYLSLIVFTPTGAADSMRGAGLPAHVLMAWIVIVVHGLGGTMLIVGLWTRWVAAANAVIMLGALVKVHLPEGFFLLLAATVALTLTGGGALAITRDR